MATEPYESPLGLTISGPQWASDKALWTAKAKVLSFDIRISATQVQRARGVRPVYVRRVPAGDDPHLPTTIVARCRINQVSLRFGDTSTPFANGSVDATLILGMDRTDWNPHLGHWDIERALCLAGEFSLASFFDLTPVPGPLRSMLDDVMLDVGHITDLRALSSGLGFSGIANMPARTLSINTAPYLIEVALPPPIPDSANNLPVNANGTVLVRIDDELLASPTFNSGRDSLKAHFADFVRRLNPSVAGTEKPRLRWSRLELADPSQIPDFYWRVTPAAADPLFEFVPGTWRLSLADQPAGITNVTARSALLTSPKVTITRDSGDVAKFHVGVNPEGQTASLPGSRPQVRYNANLGAESESITIRRADLGYNAIDVATRLRTQYGLPIPRTDDFDQATAGDTLAGTASLADFSPKGNPRPMDVVRDIWLCC